MAYETGTVTTASGMFTALGSFLIGAGWQLHDTINADHRVYYSSGGDGEEDIYVGFKVGVKDYDSEPFHCSFQNQDHPGAFMEHVNVSIMQHWDAGTNTPTNEIDGKIGPWLFYFYDDQSTGAGRLAGYTATVSNINQVTSAGGFSHTDQDFNRSNTGGLKRMGPERQAYISAVDNDITRIDITNNIETFINYNSWNEFRFVMAYDEAGIPHMFSVNSEGTQSPAWRKHPVGLGTGYSYVSLANPPAGVTTYPYTSLCWDGSDYIYMMRQANNSTVWYRYSISGDSWITMSPALPATPNRNYIGNTFNYIKKESTIGVAESWTSDKIFWLRTSTTTDGYYSYDVTGASWSNHANVTAFLDSSFSARVGDHLYANYGASNTHLWRYSIADDTWTGGVGNLPASSLGGSSMEGIERYQNQIPIDKQGVTTYWLFGDKDHFICITKMTDDTYWGFYAGTIDSYYPTQKVELTAGVSAGSDVSLTVSGQFDQFTVGKELYITDVTGGEDAAESFTLTSAAGGVLTAGVLDNPYSAGSTIGIDPQNVVMTCHYFDTVFALHGALGQGGRDSGTAPYQQNYQQALIPTDRNLVNSSAPGGRGQVQIWPIAISNHKSEDAATDTRCINEMMAEAARLKVGAGAPVDPPEARGQLRGMYCLSDGTAPSGPISEDELVIGSDRYIVFKLYNVFDSDTGHDMFVAVGPKV